MVGRLAQPTATPRTWEVDFCSRQRPQPLIKKAVKLPPNPAFNFAFKAHYGYSIFRINDMELLDWLRIGWYTRNYFSQTSF